MVVSVVAVVIVVVVMVVVVMNRESWALGLAWLDILRRSYGETAVNGEF